MLFRNLFMQRPSYYSLSSRATSHLRYGQAEVKGDDRLVNDEENMGIT